MNVFLVANTLYGKHFKKHNITSLTANFWENGLFTYY